MAEDRNNQILTSSIGVDKSIDEMELEFFPDYITDSPGILFFFKFIVMPAAIVYIIWAYIKTIRFAYNTV